MTTTTELVPREGLPMTSVMGMDMPVIAELGDGWFLVAHPNGAAIANEHLLTVLYTASRETKLASDLFDGEEYDVMNPPEVIRHSAVEIFQALAWKRMRGEFWIDE